MTDSTDDLEIYFRLLFYSELPTSPLRRPRAEWTDTEHVAAAMVELFALIDTVQFSYDYRMVAAHLAAVEPQHVARFDAALVAIGGARQRRLLALIQRELVESVAALDLTQRIDTIAARIERGEPSLLRAKYGIDPATLQRALFNFLTLKQALPDELPPHESPVVIFGGAQIPKTSVRKDARTGNRNIFLLGVNESTPATIDSWLQSCTNVRHYDAKGCTSVASYADIVAAGRVRKWEPLACSIVGEALMGAPDIDYLKDYWLFGRAQPPSEALDRIAGGFRWAIFQWCPIDKSLVLAFVTDDDAVADHFENSLSVSGAAPVSTIRRTRELASAASGVAFLEDDAFGDAALVAARHDECPPWLVIAAHDCPAHWWRKTTARLSPELWFWTSEYGLPLLMLAYRGIDTAEWRELWSHLSHDDNVAVAAASGHLPADTLRDCMAQIKTTASIDGLRLLAGKNGWSYAHIWGGGSSEHYAMFYAADAATTARVADFAGRQWPNRARYHWYW
jgi:hypothetical protein